MEVIGYNDKYREDLAKLINEFNDYIASIDTKKLTKPFKSMEANFAYTDKTIQDSIDMNGFIYLALVDGVVVGFIQGVVISKDENLFENLTHDKYLEGWIGEFYVKSEFRGQGIGKRLYEKAITFFKDQNCLHVRLLVLNDNKDAIGIYEKCGFECRGLNMIKKL